MQDAWGEGNAEAGESLLYVEPFQDNGLVVEASTHLRSLLCLRDLIAMCPGKMCGCSG